MFSGGVAVIADTWYQAKTALDAMPIEWTVPPERAAFNTGNMRAALLAALDEPGRVRVNQGDVDAAFARAERVVEATYFTPYLPRARMEPGNATVLVTDDRVDIWIGDQSPQETRFSAAQITGIPEENVYLHMCHLGGGFGRNGNGPQAEQAIMIANANRGTPIHLLWTREEDFIGTTYRAMGMARLKAALDADGWPLALEVRTSMQQDGFGPDASFDVASRYYVPNYRFSNHTTNFHVPVGTRRGVGQAAHEFYRESFIDELAHAAGKDPYRYRRELIARTELPFKADMIKALDMAAEMSGWGTPLPRGHGARDRARGARRRDGQLGDDQRDGAHGLREPRRPRQARARRRRARVGLRLGQSAVGQEADRRADHVVLQRRDAPGLQHRRTARSSRTTSTRSRCRASTRIRPRSTSSFFPTAHWLVGMGHDRGTSVQAAIADAIFQITGKRFRDLPLRQHDLSWS